LKIFRQRIQENSTHRFKHINLKQASDQTDSLGQARTGISKDELAENKKSLGSNLHIYTTIPIFGFAIHDYYPVSGCTAKKRLSSSRYDRYRQHDGRFHVSAVMNHNKAAQPKMQL
jgi:hypothetical protein